MRIRPLSFRRLSFASRSLFGSAVTRRHRFLVLALAIVASGVFLIFVTRGLEPVEQFRTCTASPIFEDLSFDDVVRTYHFTMESLLEERMLIYEGKILLQCDAQTMDLVIPPGSFARAVAMALPEMPPALAMNAPVFTYDDFSILLHELWRTYDCHLASYQSDRGSLYQSGGEGGGTIGEEAKNLMPSDIEFDLMNRVARERLLARTAFDRVLATIRPSEQYLPLHASLRCLQRGAADVRNGMALLSDALQCLPQRLVQPETSFRK